MAGLRGRAATNLRCGARRVEGGPAAGKAHLCAAGRVAVLLRLMLTRLVLQPSSARQQDGSRGAATLRQQAPHITAVVKKRRTGCDGKWGGREIATSPPSRMGQQTDQASEGGDAFGKSQSGMRNHDQPQPYSAVAAAQGF
jgi:hypothetical protein